MLHKDPFIIAPETFNLIQELQALPGLNNFFLVGGTALALQIGHRNSIDIDLFTQSGFEADSIVDQLKDSYTLRITLARNGALLAVINGIKTDFVRHNYPLLHPPIQAEGIRFTGLKDIAAMKIHAIIQSGKRLKDFIDIYYLLEHFSMKQMLTFFTAKYTYSNEMIALKALNYFDDIDPDMDPPKLPTPLPLPVITRRIREATQKISAIF